MTTTPTHPHVPMSVLLTHRILKARLIVARTTADLAVAHTEDEAARENLARLEAEYLAVTA